jgi:hypothetical protein
LFPGPTHNALFLGPTTLGGFDAGTIYEIEILRTNSDAFVVFEHLVWLARVDFLAFHADWLIAFLTDFDALASNLNFTTDAWVLLLAFPVNQNFIFGACLFAFTVLELCALLAHFLAFSFDLLLTFRTDVFTDTTNHVLTWIATVKTLFQAFAVNNKLIFFTVYAKTVLVDFVGWAIWINWLWKFL